MRNKIGPCLFLILFIAVLTACSEQSPTSNPLPSPVTPSPTVTSTSTMSTSELSTMWALTPTYALPSTPTLRPYIACMGARVSRLEVGDTAYVSLSPIPNQIRSEPSLETGEIIGQAAPGEMLEILDGPSCADDLVWWRVRVESTGLVGWTGEGDFDGWWLVPWYLFTPAPESN
jgi:hypothetical protein